MVFTKRLREGIRSGRITCSVRIWTRPHVKAGGRYRMDEGQIAVDSIRPIRLGAVTPDLARESGFGSVKDLLETARHGRGDNVFLIRFHYLPAGAWDVRPKTEDTGRWTAEDPQSASVSRTDVLRRIRSSRPDRLLKDTQGRRAGARRPVRAGQAEPDGRRPRRTR
jgi:hypothetical protein